MRSPEEVVSKLERELMTGKGRWVADFTESYRDFKVSDVVFDAYIRGNTRMRGFLISRLYSFLLNPNYEVGCFIISSRPNDRFDRRRLHKSLYAVKSFIDTNEIKWAWLFIVGGRAEDAAKRDIENIKDQSLGVVFIDTERGEAVHSKTFLGRQAKKYVRL